MSDEPNTNLPARIPLGGAPEEAGPGGAHTPGATGPAGLPAASKPAGPAKPAGPPGAAKPAGLPPGGPPGAKKPALPPGAGGPGGAVRPPARPGARPAAPPEARVVAPEGDGDLGTLPVLSKKDFVTGADVRWCPGCGDYAVLAAVQRALPELVDRRENVVFVSGIGCSSRFPYYLNTYGFHTIHGRAPAIATGLKVARPELDVWVVTGDGDALSIGAGHFVHLCRRNLDVQVLLFNNQIYGLTKGQYSPTSEPGKVTKSTPFGSVDHPFNPGALALGAGASFVARTLDRDAKHMQATLRRAADHRGTSFVEVYQNCNIFNDGAFFDFTERESKPERALFVEHGQPLIYADGKMGLALDGLRLKSLDLDGPASSSDCLVYDETDRTLATLVADQLFGADLPRPFGVLYREERSTYDAAVSAQVEAARAKPGAGDLAALLRSGETWTIEEPGGDGSSAETGG
jgi:2-oxoglutarate ferredoxin oxidoreductase subunit beta